MNPTILPMTQAPMPSAPLSPDAPAARRFAVVLTTLVAGAAGCLIAYWTWRMVLRLPLAVEPGSGVAGNAAVGDTMAATSWWVPTLIAGAVALALWPILAAHARRISLLGGSAAIVLVSLVIFPVAAICVEMAAVTSRGLPPLGDLFAAIPGIVGSAVQVTFVNLIYCGLITVPAAAFIGLLLAAGGRLMVWTVERVTHRRGDAE